MSNLLAKPKMHDIQVIRHTKKTQQYSSKMQYAFTLWTNTNMSTPMASSCYYHPNLLGVLGSLSFLYTSILQTASILPFCKSIKKENILLIQDTFDVTKTKRPLAIVTGSNTGVGYETAYALVEKGYDVILACRSRSKGEEAAERINESSNMKGKAMFLYPLDLSDLESVQSFARSFLNDEVSETGLNILVNNAGINTTGKSMQGYDLCFQTNFVGHYLLTLLLLPKLQMAENYHYNGKKENGRVANLSSVMHHYQLSKGKDMTLESWWKRCIVPDMSSNTYSESKLAMIFFTIELNKRFGSMGVHSIAANPGAV